MWGEHRPKTPGGQVACFKFEAHAGCAAGASCPFGHEESRGGAHYTHQMKAVKWGGRRKDDQGRATQPIQTREGAQREMRRLRDRGRQKTSKRFQELADRRYPLVNHYMEQGRALAEQFLLGDEMRRTVPLVHTPEATE